MLFQLRKLRPVRAIIASTFIAVVGTASASALAQETRTEEITKKQEEKAAKSQPYKPNRYEEIMNRLEESFASPPSGIFPDFGSVYPGGGFTLGAGYRHFYAREAVWEIKGLYSIKNYKLIEVGTRTPWTSDGRLVAGTRAGWRDATQVGYYGLGIDTSADDRANARIQQTFLEGNLAFPSELVDSSRGRGLRTDDFTTKEGQGSALLPSRRCIRPTTAPGLFSAAELHREPGAPPPSTGVPHPATRAMAAIMASTFRDLFRYRQDVQLPTSRRRDHPAHSHPASRRGSSPFAAGCSRCSATIRCAVLPVAVSRKRAHAARLPDGALPRSERAAHERSNSAGYRARSRWIWRSSTMRGKSRTVSTSWTSTG